MADRHDRSPVSFRPPQPEEKWLRDYVQATGQSVGTILTEALRLYRSACERADALLRRRTE